jgi:hypothetical protein
VIHNADSAILQFLTGQPHVRNVVEWNGDEFIFTDRGIYYVPLATGGAALQPGTIRFALISDATASSIKPTITRDALIFTSASNDRVSAIIRTGNFTTPYAEQDLTPYHSQLLVSVRLGGVDLQQRREIFLAHFSRLRLELLLQLPEPGFVSSDSRTPFVEVLTKCRVQHLWRGDLRFVAAGA